MAGAILMVAAFGVPRPHGTQAQGLRAAIPAGAGPGRGGGHVRLTMLPGLGFGVLDVLAPLRISALGGSAADHRRDIPDLCGAGDRAVAAGRTAVLTGARACSLPVQLSLAAAVVLSLLAPTLAPEFVLVAALIVGMPSFGTMFAA